MPQIIEIRRQPVSKLDAACRQLKVAIRLFFERSDSLAIHTLAAAAHQVLTDILHKTGRNGLLKNNPLIRDCHKKEWRDTLARAENFLKHADRDPDDDFDFYSASTEPFIFDAVQMYQTLANARFREGDIFVSWFFVAHSHLILEGPSRDKLRAALPQIPDVDPHDRSIWKSIIEDVQLYPMEK